MSFYTKKSVSGSYKSAVALKSVNPALRVMLAIGGWNEGGKKYSQMSASADSRRRFIKSAIDLLAANGFDGLDLDWEYPGATDRQGGTRLTSWVWIRGRVGFG